jgi:exopolysaccharide biosynthesis polyprenyl glycosylphosphotransferase
MYEVSRSEYGTAGSAEKTASTYSEIETQSGVAGSAQVEGRNHRDLRNLLDASFHWASRSSRRVLTGARAKVITKIAFNYAQRFTVSVGSAAIVNCATDLFYLLVALFLSTLMSDRPAGMEYPEFALTTIIAGLLWIVASAVLRHYDRSAFERNAAEDAALVSILVMAVTTMLALVNLVVRESAAVPKVPQFLLAFWPMALFLRLLVFRAVSENEGPSHQVLIVGAGALARFTSEDLERRGRHRIVGFLEFPGEACSGSLSSRLLGPANAIERILRKTAVNEVFVAGEMLKHSDSMQATIRVCERLGVPFAVPAHNFRFERAQPVDNKAVADGYLHYDPVARKPHLMALKRLFDIVAASLVLEMVMPLFVVIAVLIKIDSRGPVFFRQERVGLRGRQFHMLKFRSMVVNAEELKALLRERNERTGPVFKIHNDPRITRIGRFLRKYSLDELPQLINVLRGQMSVVGPRPPVPSEVAFYEPWQLRRLAVCPGLTCIWQSCADRHQISFEEWMYLDMQYIDHWSLARDFALIGKTLPVVLAGNGER